MEKIKLPKEGIFVGSGVYPTDTDTLLCTMLGHYSWQCQYFSPMEMIDKIIEDNQGNLAQLWGYARGFSPRLHGEWLYALDEIGINIPAPDWENYKNLTLKEYKELFEEHKDRFGEGIVRFIREAKKRGIYTALIYTDAAKGVPPKMCAEGEWYLGYDFGERYNIGLSEAKKILEESGSLKLSALAASLTRRVREHCDERRESGWGHIMATSANFSLDYEILGGADIPVVEDFAFPNLNFASGYSRGLYRQHDLPLWGSHLAHEHYSWLPCKDPRRLEELKAGMYLKYMAGSKMIINESGNWFVEHTLSPDSPKFNVPQTAREKFGILGWGDSRKLLEESPEKIKPLLEEARPYFKDLDYNSEVCRGYRRVISEFWDFVKANGTPEGQPETTIALAKGNCDLTSARYNHNYALSGLYDIAAENPCWFQCAPERGWKTARAVFFPEVPIFEPYPNIQLSGTPYGQVDVVSFADNKITAEFLNQNYKTLLFTGWNTSSAEQYEILKQYVYNGGTLFISLPQLSTNETRSFSFGVDELVNGGDFSELCGLKILGRGDCIYWAMNAEGKTIDGVGHPRRYGILGVPMGKAEITDPELEVLITDDEQGLPVVTMHKYGKGKCCFLNTWTYPGALDNDEGPGGLTNSHGLVGCIYRMLAEESRGEVYITCESDRRRCDYIAYSYFKESGDICLYNVDFAEPHTVTLHTSESSAEITLGPGEFRRIKYNGEK